MSKTLADELSKIYLNKTSWAELEPGEYEEFMEEMWKSMSLTRMRYLIKHKHDFKIHTEDEIDSAVSLKGNHKETNRRVSVTINKKNNRVMIFVESIVPVGMDIWFQGIVDNDNEMKVILDCISRSINQ